MQLNGKVAVVTGGTKGIGREISLLLANSGAKVCSIYNDDEGSKQEFEEIIKKLNIEYLILKYDVSKKENSEKIFQKTLEKFGKVDILINNAGVFLDTEDEVNLEKRFKKVFDVNFFACVYLTEEFAKFYKGDLGKIINISSIAGINPFSYTGGTRSPEYCCSKASLDLYTKISAKNFVGKILVNGIAPGSTKTPIWEGTSEDFLEIRAKESIIGRFMKPQEIATTAKFILENDAINGEVIVVDGGNILN